MILNRNQSRGCFTPAETATATSEEKTETRPVRPCLRSHPPPSRFKAVPAFSHPLGERGAVGFLVELQSWIPVAASPGQLEKRRERTRSGKFTLAVQSKLLTSLQSDQARLIVLRALSELRAARLALSSDEKSTCRYLSTSLPR